MNCRLPNAHNAHTSNAPKKIVLRALLPFRNSAEKRQRKKKWKIFSMHTVVRRRSKLYVHFVFTPSKWSFKCIWIRPTVSQSLSRIRGMVHISDTFFDSILPGNHRRAHMSYLWHRQSTIQFGRRFFFLPKPAFLTYCLCGVWFISAAKRAVHCL